MALKDCLAKMSKANMEVSAEDTAALKGFIKDGMSDAEAVRKLLLDANQNVVDIADRAKKEGATVKPKANVLLEVAKFQAKKLEAVAKETQAVESEIESIEDSYNSLASIEQKAEQRARLKELKAQQKELGKRVDAIFSGTRQTYLQKGPRKKHRGSISYDDLGKLVIRLTSARNMSTFLHEGGHMFLEIMGDLSEMPEAPQKAINDFQRVLNFLGVEHREQIGEDQHELWAVAFEAYLREGKAPSAELQDAFAAFKVWFARIYKTLLGLKNVELNDEIRGVFDRLLATEEAITDAELAQEHTALYATAELMGVSQEVFDAHRAKIVETHNEAVDRESQRLLKVKQREAMKWWRAEWARVMAEITEQAHAMPVYRALAMLQKGTNPDGSTPSMGAFKLAKTDEMAKEVTRRRVYAAEGGVDADVAAQIFGFSTGGQMLQALATAPTMKAFIQAQTQAEMNRRYPDPLVDGTLVDSAIKAVHNEKGLQILAAEMRELRRQTREHRKIVKATKDEAARTDREAMEANKAQMPKRGELAAIKAAAEEAVGSMRIRDVKPHVFLRAESKAGRLVREAFEKKDYQTAYYQRLKQIQAHEMYRAAIKAIDRTNKGQKHLRRLDSRKVQERLGKGKVLDPILAIVEGIDFRKISQSEADRNAAVNEILAAAEDGRIAVPTAVLNKLVARGTHWKNLSVDEFRDMVDLVKMLEHLAKTHDYAYFNGEWVKATPIFKEIAADIKAKHGGGPRGTSQASTGERATVTAQNMLGVWMGPHHLAEFLDKEDFGVFNRYLIIPMRRAYAEYVIPNLAHARDDISAIYREHFTNAERVELIDRERTFAEINGEMHSKSDVLSLGLHYWSGNRAKLLGSMKEDAEGKRTIPAYPEQDVLRALAKLTSKDLAFLQAMWDYQNTYWPQLRDTSKRRRGVAPQKIETVVSTVKTADGKTVVLRASYQPISYDSRHGAKHASSEVLDTHFGEISVGRYVTAGTRAGATYNRTETTGLVVQLGLNITDRNIQEIIRDIGLGDEVQFINRMLNNNEIAAAFRRAGKEAYLDVLKVWLRDAAVGQLAASHPIDRGIAHVRTGFIVSKIGAKVATGVLQITGIFQSIAYIGYEAMSVGVAKFMQNPVDMYRQLITGWTDDAGNHHPPSSQFMHTRYGFEAFNKDVRDVKVGLQDSRGGIPTNVGDVQEYARSLEFAMLKKFQSVVDAMSWLGAYWKGKEQKNLSDPEAKFYADAQVAGAQTSGFWSDRSAFERGSLTGRNPQSQWVRLWTPLIGYQLTKANIGFNKIDQTIKNPSPERVFKTLADIVMLYTIDGVAGALIHGRWPDPDDDEDTWLKFAAQETAITAISGVPLFREFTAARYGGGSTPWGDLTNEGFNLYTQVLQGDADKALLRSALNTTGVLFHYPSSQINATLGAMNEDDATLPEYLFGPRKDK